MTSSRKSKSKANRWHLQRNLIPIPDGQRRWDRAYQNLLLWSQLVPDSEPAPLELPLEQSTLLIKKLEQEVSNDITL